MPSRRTGLFAASIAGLTLDARLALGAGLALGIGLALGAGLTGCHSTTPAQPVAPASSTPAPAPGPGPAPAPPPAASPAASASAPVAKILTFSVITGGRPEGNAEIRIEPGGHHTSHFTFNDRGRGPDIRTTLTVDAAGAITAFTATGHDYLKAPVDEQLTQAAGTLAWKSTSEHGDAPAGAGLYVPLSDSLDAPIVLVHAMQRAADHRVKLLPAGEAWIEDDTARDIELAGVKQRVHRVAIAGVSFSPLLIWLDDHDELFGYMSTWSSIVRTGGEPAIATLLADDQAWVAARSGKLAAQLAHHPPAAGLAITHARLFDSVRKTIVPDATVIVVGDRITQVGSSRTPIPAGAQVIDAHGRTLLPGLWDMHVHLSDDDGVLDLAAGITTVRDLGNDIPALAARIARFDAGTELGPRVLRAGLIDGAGPFTAPIGTIVENAEQAVAAVAAYADAGYPQIKIYSSVPPPLVPVIAKAAHARHLRVSGHVPSGMVASQAVEAGYDEIQHVNFLFLQFLARPGDDTRTPLRFTRVAEQAAGLDLAGPEVKQFLDLLIAHKTVIDPTVSAFHGMFTSDPGELAPVLVPYAARLPAQILRGSYGGGLPAPDGKRATYRASYAALLKLVKRAWDKQIRIVAGTDDIAGLTLAHELEQYVQAGIPAPDVLSIATIGAARIMGIDRDAGSITVGKRADLVLVDGDPTRDIAAVRNADTVVCRGVVYDPAELFAAVGMRGR
ncbi:MAG TPA: amidohydrolase family protein [Kofleriaceae bacterium]|nr:amidohydrolase family protein [Kofleriaceae bacterium]